VEGNQREPKVCSSTKSAITRPKASSRLPWVSEPWGSGATSSTTLPAPTRFCWPERRWPHWSFSTRHSTTWSHVSRAFNGLGKLADSKEATALNPGMVATLKRIARFVPFHRIFHSVEMSLMALISSIVTVFAVSAGAGPLFGERWLVFIMAPLCMLSVIGHFLSIMASRRLS
jgi:hypothetical protein